MIKLLTIIFLTTIYVSVWGENIEEELKTWGIDAQQTERQLTINDFDSRNLSDLSYNLSYLMTSLDFILEGDEDFTIEYMYRNSDIVIEKEWFDTYQELESEKEKRQLIQLLLETIEGE